MSTNFENSSDYKKIFSFHPSITDRIISRESNSLEFKETFNWNSKDKYVKSMTAFANNHGGFLVFGITDNPRDLKGLQSTNFETLDEAKITAYLNSVFAPEIIFEKFTVAINSKTIGIIHVHQSKTKPIVCIKNDGELKEAEIYYRYNARSEKIKYPELKKLFELAKEEERKIWMDHLEKISKIGPSNVAILDTLAGEISGKGGTLVIDKKLISKLRFINQGTFQEGGKPVLKLIGNVKPVSVITGSSGSASDFQFTNDPSAPAVRVEEENIFRTKYPIDNTTLMITLRERYINFKANPEFYKLKKEFMKDENLSRKRYLNPFKQKSSSQDFFSPNIIEKFDPFYTKK